MTKSELPWDDKRRNEPLGRNQACSGEGAVPTMVIAVLESRRRQLIREAKELLTETDQARRCFIERELLLACTLCALAETDAQMGDLANVPKLVQKIRQAVESAKRRTAECVGDSLNFQEQVRTRLDEITRRIRELEKLTA